MDIQMGIQVGDLNPYTYMFYSHIPHQSHTNPVPTDFYSTCQQQGGVRTPGTLGSHIQC